MGDLSEVKTVFPSCDPDLLSEIVVLTEKKLYHQLATTVLTLLKPVMKGEPCGDLSHCLYEKFLSSVEKYIDPLALVECARAIAITIADADKKLTFIQHFEKLVADSDEANILWLSLKGEVVSVGKRDVYGARDCIDQAEKLFRRELDASIHSAFHKAQACMYKQSGDLMAFYKAMLNYLAYTDVDSIPSKDRAELACEVAVTALLAPQEFNFGQLLLQPLLTAQEVKGLWVLDLLKAFYDGSMKAYESVLAANENVITSDTKFVELKNEYLSGKLTQKMAVCALSEKAFQKPKADRVLTFGEIGATCKVDVKEVEFLIMRAMSRGQIKGSIDQVLQNVTIDWVKPRVLDVTRMNLLRFRLDGWRASTQALITQLEEQTPDLLVA